jgi:hypothetical protein
MGNTELVLSTHRDVINPPAIEGKTICYLLVSFSDGICQLK